MPLEQSALVEDLGTEVTAPHDLAPPVPLVLVVVVHRLTVKHLRRPDGEVMGRLERRGGGCGSIIII